MQAIILAGGMGTRLRPVVDNKPKPMAEVAGRPFLEYQIGLLKRYGLTDLILCIGYLSEQIVDYFANGAQWEVSIQYALEEQSLLGTGGAIKNAERLIKGTFLVLNGDTYFDIDLQKLIQFHESKRHQDVSILGTLAVVEVTNSAAYGSVWMDNESRIVGFAEKATGCSPVHTVSAGVYVLEPAVLEFIPSGKRVSIERETFPLILSKGRNLLGYIAEGFFVDIGTPTGYARFQSHVREV